MRIALLTGEYPPQPGGVGDYTRRLGQALAARGHVVFVYTIYDSRFRMYDLCDPNRASEVVDHISDWGWGSWRHVIAALEQTRPDLLHIQYQTGAYDMRPAVNLLPWRLRGLPARLAVAVTMHDLLLPYLFPKAGPLRRWVTRRLLRDADAVVVTNEADLAQVHGTGNFGLGDPGWRARAAQAPSLKPLAASLIPIGSNIAVAPPAGYDRAAWRARLGVAAGETLVAYFGLISRTKGLDTLLDALAQLPRRFRLLVVGGAATAPEDREFAGEIARQMATAELYGRAIVTGHCPDAEVSAHLLAADIAALPYADGASFRRGSLLAALAHGVPTVTTTPTDGQGPTTDDRRPTTDDQGPRTNDQGPTTDDRRPTTTEQSQEAEWIGRSSFILRPLVDGENVLLVPPGDARALALAIERLAGDPGLRERVGAGARALAAQFGWEEIAARHEQLYARMIGR